MSESIILFARHNNMRQPTIHNSAAKFENAIKPLSSDTDIIITLSFLCFWQLPHNDQNV